MNIEKEMIIEFKNGMKVINVSPHPMRFQEIDGSITILPASGIVLNAEKIEMNISDQRGIRFIKTHFSGSKEGSRIIKNIKEKFPEVYIVGSMIAAQAYPGNVISVTPIEGFERSCFAEKRMSTEKFNMF